MQQLARGVVAVLEVVQHQHQRGAFRRGPQQLQHGATNGVGHQGGVGAGSRQRLAGLVGERRTHHLAQEEQRAAQLGASQEPAQELRQLHLLHRHGVGLAHAGGAAHQVAHQAVGRPHAHGVGAALPELRCDRARQVCALHGVERLTDQARLARACGAHHHQRARHRLLHALVEERRDGSELPAAAHARHLHAQQAARARAGHVHVHQLVTLTAQAAGTRSDAPAGSPPRRRCARGWFRRSALRRLPRSRPPRPPARPAAARRARGPRPRAPRC
jgi:hypothetical protein